ncbi:MAG: class I SAM-dependent methyltransferase [Deltaproteobacteria bacterium]|nr:class I SAM-dependent methyltransferase [Deltaproteobacteria bacterium]
MSTCDLCGGPLASRLVKGGLSVVACRPCKLARLSTNGQEQGDPVHRYRTASYFEFWGDDHEATREQKKRTAWHLLERLERARLGRRGRLLEVGCASGELLEVAIARGWDVAGVEPCVPMAKRANARLRSDVVQAVPFGEVACAAESADAVVFNDVLEHLPDLREALSAAHRLLARGGTVLVCTPDLESASARLMGPLWTHYKAEHLHYLSKTSMRRYIELSGFRLVSIEDAWKSLSPAYIAEHMRVYGSIPGVGIVASLVRLLPRTFRHAPIPLLTGNLLAIAEKPGHAARD